MPTERRLRETNLVHFCTDLLKVAEFAPDGVGPSSMGKQFTKQQSANALAQGMQLDPC